MDDGPLSMSRHHVICFIWGRRRKYWCWLSDLRPTCVATIENEYYKFM